MNTDVPRTVENGQLLNVQFMLIRLYGKSRYGSEDHLPSLRLVADL